MSCFSAKDIKAPLVQERCATSGVAMMGRTDKGLIITTGTFSPDARKEATRDGAPPIDLIDGVSLCEKLKDLRLGVEVKLVEEMIMKPEFFEQI